MFYWSDSSASSLTLIALHSLSSSLDHSCSLSLSLVFLKWVGKLTEKSNFTFNVIKQREMSSPWILFTAIMRVLCIKEATENISNTTEWLYKYYIGTVSSSNILTFFKKSCYCCRHVWEHWTAYNPYSALPLPYFQHIMKLITYKALSVFFLCFIFSETSWRDDLGGAQAAHQWTASEAARVHFWCLDDASVQAWCPTVCWSARGTMVYL